jgi:S-adenosylmethionine:tRNA ribosyltransferase-isomerase
MVLGNAGIAHRQFRDLPQLLRAGDVLVLNETRVIAARLFGERIPTGGHVELLLLHPAGSPRYDAQARRWIALARPARRLHAGERIAIGDPELRGEARIVAELPDGAREIELALPVSLEAFLARAGRMPLPPYIHNDAQDARERYQTVFARVPGSVAAPTASLHFTRELLEALTARGIETARLVLDVGIGTFRPVATERIHEHAMHAEAYTLPQETVEAIERAHRERRRVIAVGTTVMRTLEGNVSEHGRLVAGDGTTDIFITPGFAFHVVDALITNFHLPRSTLLMLVSAFVGRERILDAYAQAIKHRYRFFSFGDAMFVENRNC